MGRLFRWSILFAMGIAAVAGELAAEVVRIVVERREDVLGGKPFGSVGPYEKIIGRAYFVFDPANPMNARIVDLDKAPRNADGLVEAWANFTVLRPKHPARGGGVALIEVSNRGGKASLGYFNGGRFAVDPTTEEEFGDGLLMRMGLTVIWVGWQFDVPRRDGILRLHVPTATENGESITGLVRADWVIDRAAERLTIGHRNHTPYAIADPDAPQNVLTVPPLLPRKCPKPHRYFQQNQKLSYR